MEIVHCPICESTHQKLLETLNVSDVVALYKKLLGKDIVFNGLCGEFLQYYECKDCSLRHFSPIVPADENLYELLQKFPWYYLDAKEEYKIVQQFLSDLIKTNINLLEVGAGKGAFRSYLKHDDHYVGLEFSKEAIRLGKENNVILYPEMIEEYSIKNPNCYDVVCSFQVLEHVANPKSFIESCLMALKPEGILIIAVPSEDSFMKNVVNHALNMPPHHCTRYSDEMLKNIGKLFNLELLSIKHEPMSDEKLYLATLYWLQSKLLKPKVLDLTLKRRIVGFLCRGFVKVFKIRKRKQNNHTVLAFYKKNKA